MISVIMSVYNEEIIDLERAVSSILNQTFKNFEFLIIQDNPDNSNITNYLKEIEKKDNRVKLICNSYNIGLAKSLNKGLSHAKYNIIARMDADDESYPTRLQIEYDIINLKKVDLVFSQCNFVDEANQIIKTSKKFPYGNKLIKTLKFKNIIPHPTVMYRKDVVQNLGGYSTIPIAEDYDLWMRMINKRCKFYPINQILLNYQVRLNSMTNSNYYKTYLADRLIKKQYKKQYKKKITYKDYMLFYEQHNKKNFSDKFNRYSQKYFELLKTKSFKNLIQLIVLTILHRPLFIMTWNNINSIKYRR